MPSAVPTGLSKDLPNGGLQAVAHPLQRADRGVLFASLQSAVVRAMHLDLGGKVILTESERLAAPAEYVAYSLGHGTAFHGRVR